MVLQIEILLSSTYPMVSGLMFSVLRFKDTAGIKLPTFQSKDKSVKCGFDILELISGDGYKMSPHARDQTLG